MTECTSNSSTWTSPWPLHTRHQQSESSLQPAIKARTSCLTSDKPKLSRYSYESRQQRCNFPTTSWLVQQHWTSHQALPHQPPAPGCSRPKRCIRCLGLLSPNRQHITIGPEAANSTTAAWKASTSVSVCDTHNEEEKSKGRQKTVRA